MKCCRYDADVENYHPAAVTIINNISLPGDEQRGGGGGGEEHHHGGRPAGRAGLDLLAAQ